MPILVLRSFCRFLLVPVVSTRNISLLSSEKLQTEAPEHFWIGSIESKSCHTLNGKIQIYDIKNISMHHSKTIASIYPGSKRKLWEVLSPREGRVQRPPLFLWPWLLPYTVLSWGPECLYMVRNMQESDDEQVQVRVHFVLTPGEVCETWGYKMLPRGW